MITKSRSRALLLVRPGILFATALTFTLGCHGAQSVPRADERIAPDGAAILDRYVEVTGGVKARARIRNRVSEVRVVHAGMDLEERTVTHQARPSRRHSSSVSDAFGTTESGIDGGLVWFVSDNTGPVIEEGEARDAAIDGATFDRSAHWRKHYKDAKYIGEETVGGKRCVKVAMTPRVGKPETRFFDKHSGLLLKIAKTQLTSVGMQPTTSIEILLDDYRPVDGLLIAHRATQSVDMCGRTHETIYVTQSIKHNVSLPSDQFDPPKEVKAFARDPARSKGTGRPGCKSASRATK